MAQNNQDLISLEKKLLEKEGIKFEEETVDLKKFGYYIN